MKRLIEFFIYVSMVVVLSVAASGCGQLKDRRLSNDLKSAVNAVEVVCGVAKVLADSGADIPGVEQCETILPRLNGDEMAAVVAIVGCADGLDIKDPAVIECAARNGWPVIKQKLALFSEK